MSVTCENIAQHTACPTDYREWHEWAREMDKSGHRQRKCSTCGLLAIWVIPSKRGDK